MWTLPGLRFQYKSFRNISFREKGLFFNWVFIVFLFNTVSQVYKVSERLFEVCNHMWEPLRWFILNILFSFLNILFPPRKTQQLKSWIESSLFREKVTETSD